LAYILVSRYNLAFATAKAAHSALFFRETRAEATSEGGSNAANHSGVGLRNFDEFWGVLVDMEKE
jgi:hypothetical protein